MSAFIKNEPTLRFITSQNRKHDTSVTEENQNIEVWTLLSSPKFAKTYKGPQENLPNELQEEVISLLLESLERSLGLSTGSIDKESILDHRLQLWGAAVPLNTWTSEAHHSDTSAPAPAMETGFLFDSEHGVGACGDGLLDPSIPGAWESGRRLASWITESKAQSIGLPSATGAFRISKAASAAGIGNVQ